MYIKNSKKTFVRKTEVPARFEFTHFGLPRELPQRLLAEEGWILAYWADVGWGALVQEGKATGSFADELVIATAGMIQQRWKPWAWQKNFGWVTCRRTRTRSWFPTSRIASPRCCNFRSEKMW